MRWRNTFIALIVCFMLGGGLVSAGMPPAPQTTTPHQTNLGTSDWWVVAYEYGTDFLYWINRNGEQAAIKRPHLPNETATNVSQMQISRNGQYLLVLSNIDTQGLGFGVYDIQQGKFTFTITPPVNESTILPKSLAFSEDSTQLAIGTVNITPDFQQFSWRVTIYDVVTGAVVDELRSDGSEIQAFVGGEFFTQSPLAPSVTYFDTNSANLPNIHIQFLSYGGEGPLDVPTLAWYPQGSEGLVQELYSSPYTRMGLDINPATDEGVFIYEDSNLGSLAGIGLFTNYNAIARGTPDNPIPILSSASNYYRFARWAAGGGMTYFGYGDANLNENVAYMRMGGGAVDMPGFTSGASLPNGIAWYTQSGELNVHYADFSSPDAVVWQGNTNAVLLWGSDTGAEFALTTIAAPDVATQPAVTGSISLCAGTPASRMAIGINARVTFTDGKPLNVRTAPGSSLVVQIPEGTAFVVIGGHQCQGEFTWWQVRLSDGQEGWVAEGDNTNYFIEPVVDEGTGNG